MEQINRINPIANALKVKSSTFFSPTSIQPKLTIGAPNDKYEQEANAMADKIMTMPDNDFMVPMPIQRKCSGCAEEERVQTMPLVMRSGNGSMEATPVLSRQLTSSKGKGSQLPAHVNQHMSGAFATDFSQVRVHTDDVSQQMNQGIQAKAFTHGSDVYFNKGQYNPDSSDGKRLLAHELTHVVQQGGSRQSAQRYTNYNEDQQNDNDSLGWEHPENKPLMVSDDGKMAVEYEPWDAKKSWVLSSMIQDTNQTLTARGSRIRVSAGAQQIKGKAPNRSSSFDIILNKVVVENPTGGTGRLTGDCGTACYEAMGGTSTPEFRGVINSYGGQYRTPGVGYRGGWGVGSNTTTNEISGHIFVRIMSEEYGRTLLPQQAREAYDSLSVEEKDRIDRKYGLNRYLNPEVGQGLTTGTEFNMPGFKTDKELSQRTGGIWGGIVGGIAGGALGALGGALLGGSESLGWGIGGGLIGGILGGLAGYGIGRAIKGADADNTWNFHFATVLFRSGEDYVTIENVARRSDTDWLFMMYGSPEENQSFHDFQTRAEHGNKSTSMIVE